MTFCVLGENCSVFDRHHEMAGLSRYNPLCDGCRIRTERELHLLRYDYVDLSQLIPKMDGNTDVRIARPKPASAPPINIEIFTLRSEIAVIVNAAEKALRVWLDNVLPATPPAREGFTLDGAVRYLQPRVNDLAELGPMPGLVGEYGGPGFILEFGALHRAARRMCGLDARVMSVPGLCPSCSVPALRRHDDDPGRVWCGFCTVQLSKADYYAAQRMQFAPPAARNPLP